MDDIREDPCNLQKAGPSNCKGVEEDTGSSLEKEIVVLILMFVGILDWDNSQLTCLTYT